jgi:hypothetical protein
MLGNYRVAAQLVASRVVLSSTELVSYNCLVLYQQKKNSVVFTQQTTAICRRNLVQTFADRGVSRGQR